MTWTLWTIIGVLMIPVVIAGLAVAWRDRGRNRAVGHRGEHQAGEGEGYASAGFAATQRGIGHGGGGA
ncbi:hypothetical protein [Salsipaludibacter albus]|uniref:hypothetical protein n=1 Tax=Salsipaludibacter albus TaxID=2849650 RepID=UPI001EE465C6|nr:hypothetical protein [Salsipaludibacter albus]MBY5161817.1 hypothetical protein [Salsipaludibacter albus]